MSDFLATYGPWLLIALLIVIVILFIVSGRKSDSAAPTAKPVAPAIDPVVSPETEPMEEMLAEASVAPAPAPAPAPAMARQGGAIPPKKPAVTPPAPAGDAAPEIPETRAEELPISPAVTSVPDAPDNLLLLKGVGPKLAALLTELNVTSFAQVAAWTDDDLAAVDARLGNFKGRPVRDQWVDQARYLAAGDTAGFEAKYGKL